MEHKYLTRQLDILPPEITESLEVTVIGAGAIGSFVVLSLAKMGYTNIKVYDYDTIDDENINCQFYPIDDVGESKVLALKKLVEQFTGVSIDAVHDKVTDETKLSGDILITAVDSMKVRQLAFDNFKDSFNYIVDPRMSAETMSIQVCEAKCEESVKSYTNTLYSDEEAIQERCTAKSTMYTVQIVSGFVARIVKDISLNANYIRNLSIENTYGVWWMNDGTKATV